MLCEPHALGLGAFVVRLALPLATATVTSLGVLLAVAKLGGRASDRAFAASLAAVIGLFSIPLLSKSDPRPTHQGGAAMNATGALASLCFAVVFAWVIAEHRPVWIAHGTALVAAAGFWLLLPWCLSVGDAPRPMRSFVLGLRWSSVVLGVGAAAWFWWSIDAVIGRAETIAAGALLHPGRQPPRGIRYGGGAARSFSSGDAGALRRRDLPADPPRSRRRRSRPAGKA